MGPESQGAYTLAGDQAALRGHPAYAPPAPPLGPRIPRMWGLLLGLWLLSSIAHNALGAYASTRQLMGALAPEGVSPQGPVSPTVLGSWKAAGPSPSAR